MSDSSQPSPIRNWVAEWKDADHAAFSPEFWSEWWRKAAIRWDHSLLAWAEYDTHFLRHTDPDEVMLEAGCGSAGVVKFLEDHGRRRVIGLDFSFETLRAVRRADPRMKLVVGDIRRLPIRRAACDCILSLGVVEHFTAGPEELLSEMRAAMKTGGRMIFTVPYLNPLEALAQRFDPRKRRRPNAVFYQYLFRESEARGLLNQAGFRIEARAFCNRLGIFYHYYCRLRERLRRPVTAPPPAAAAAPAAEPMATTDAGTDRSWMARLAQLVPGRLSATMLLYVASKSDERR